MKQWIDIALDMRMDIRVDIGFAIRWLILLPCWLTVEVYLCTKEGRNGDNMRAWRGDS